MGDGGLGGFGGAAGAPVKIMFAPVPFSRHVSYRSSGRQCRAFPVAGIPGIAAPENHRPGPGTCPPGGAAPANRTGLRQDRRRRHQRQGLHLRHAGSHAARGGFQSGLYTSPHLIDFNERVRVNGELASDAALVAAVPGRGGGPGRYRR